MTAARRHAPRTAAAAARAAAAAARVGEARSDLLPQLGATARDVRQSLNSESFGFDFPQTPGVPSIPKKIGPFTVADARLTGEMTLLDASAWARLGAAKENRTAAAASIQTAELDAAAAAAGAYLSLARGESLLRARAADTLLARRLLDIAQQRKDAGVATAIDITRARVRLAAARTAFTEASGTVDRGRVALLRSMGEPLGRAIEVDTLGAPATSLSADPDSLVSLALANRPELRAVSGSVDAARQNLRAERLEVAPRLTVAGDYGYDGRHFGDAIATQTLALQLTWNAWNGGRRGARLDERTALLREAEAQGRDARLAVEADARDAAAALATARSALATTRERLQLARLELDQAEERYRDGLTGSLDVITSEEGLVQARSAYVDALYAVHAAEIGARSATGTLVPLTAR